MTRNSPGTRPGPAAALAVMAVAAALWWVISDGAAASWLVGVPAVLAAAWAFLRLGGGTGPRLALAATLRFVPWFLWESLRGGLDVALRVLAPRPRIRPGFARYSLALQGAAPRVFFVNCISLVPGTLATELEDDTVLVHALSTDHHPLRGLPALERAVGAMFRDPGVAP